MKLLKGVCTCHNWVIASKTNFITRLSIQLLLLHFLHVIWSMPANFAFSKNRSRIFFYKFDNLEINRHQR